MTSVSESQDAKHQLAATLEEGVLQLSERQGVTFTQYLKVTLPTDGSVFWVKTGTTIEAQGSFHYATNQNQNQDESASVNSVIFTSLTEVNALNDVAPDALYVGEFEGVRFAFNQRRSYFKQAGLHHYTGNALYATMQTQLVDTLGDLFEQLPVVSNSLPLWLSIQQTVAFFPSFLVAPNQAPPYVAVHVDTTESLQASPLVVPIYAETNGVIDRPLRIVSTERHQLAKDKVRLTLWGLRSDQAQRLLDSILSYMEASTDLGLMNMPILKDEKATQTELNILGQKKTIEFEVSYYQSRASQCGRQLILSVLPSYILGV